MYLLDLKTEDAGIGEQFLIFVGIALSIGGMGLILYNLITLDVGAEMPILFVEMSMIILGTMFTMWGTIHAHLGKMANLKSLDITQ